MRRLRVSTAAHPRKGRLSCSKTAPFDQDDVHPPPPRPSAREAPAVVRRATKEMARRYTRQGCIISLVAQVRRLRGCPPRRREPEERVDALRGLRGQGVQLRLRAHPGRKDKVAARKVVRYLRPGPPWRGERRPRQVAPPPNLSHPLHLPLLPLPLLGLLHGRRRTHHPRPLRCRCEDCQASRANFAAKGSTQKRWCGRCKDAHPGAEDRARCGAAVHPANIDCRQL